MVPFKISQLRYMRLLLLLVSLGLSLTLGEMVLRFGFGQKFAPPPYPPMTYRPELYQPNELYGYQLWPSRSTTYLYPLHNPRKLKVVSNSDGFRSSREFDEFDDRVRIMMVGDSFVFGEGVEEHERFTNVLETMQPTWRVDNLGLPGYGPDLMVRALEAVGLTPVPDVVVFCLYTDDFHRVRPHYAGVGFIIPRFKLEAGQLVTIPYPKPRLWDRLHIVQAIRHVYWNYSKAAFDLNAAILDRFLKLAELHHFAPVIIFLPAAQDLRIDKQRRTWLRKYTEQNATPFLDLTESMHKAGQQVFIKNNWHLNPHGHYIVAAELRSFLAKQLSND